NNKVYDKIRRQSEEWGVKSGDTATDNGSGLWVQVKGALESFKKDENSLEDYTDTAMGVMFGFDRFLEDKLWNGDLMWGAYARIDKDRIEQGNSKADGNKNGLGLYGGYIKDGWELKAMLLGSYDRFSTERAAYSGAIAKADINGVTVSADAEAALKIGIIQNLKLRPYAGVEIANTKYGGFKESGAGIYNLDTRSGNYLRTAGRAGVGLDYEKGIWIWYANAEGKYVIDGTKPEVKSQFADTGIDFYSRGAEEGRIQIGAGAGGEVRIAKDWKLFANAKYYTAERYENISGNAGLRYVFGKKQYTSEQTRLQKAEEALMEREAKQKEAEGKRRNEAIIKKEVDEIVAEEVMQAEARRMAEEARITKEISDAELAKKKSEAEARRKRPMLKTYTLTTHFKTDMYFLTEEFKRQLWAIAEELKEYEYNMITIEGHTDSTGTSEWNKKLSRQRAKSVYDELIRAGVDVNKIEYQGYSYTMPVASNKTAEGRAENRRTEVFVE
ncbi:MAG: autotransporter domain-containing protein, partial [Endomicrobia bacterium]|nr:autotransporter domain-containing protein [Endomicrobiia bacterium]